MRYPHNEQKKGIAGLERGGIDVNGLVVSNIVMYDSAWHTAPDHGIWGLIWLPFIFKNKINFEGTLTHELTHAVVEFHPEVLDRWIELTDYSKCNIWIGIGYDWTYYSDLKGSEAYELAIQNELFAITVESLGYDPFWR
jgi:hypothetical protein